MLDHILLVILHYFLVQNALDQILTRLPVHLEDAVGYNMADLAFGEIVQQVPILAVAVLELHRSLWVLHGKCPFLLRGQLLEELRFPGHKFLYLPYLLLVETLTSLILPYEPLKLTNRISLLDVFSILNELIKLMIEIVLFFVISDLFEVCNRLLESCLWVYILL